MEKLPSEKKYPSTLNDLYFEFINNKAMLKNNKNGPELYIRAKRQYIRRTWKRVNTQLKKTFWKKLMLKRFFMSLYLIDRLYQLKAIVKSARRLHGNKFINFYLYLESRIIPTCVRMYFFTTIRRGLNWIKWGFVYLNSYVVSNTQVQVKFNSVLRIFLFPVDWSLVDGSNFRRIKRIMRLTQFIFQYYEFGLSYFISIVLFIPDKFSDVKAFFSKRKKRWVSAQTFAFLATGFY